MPTKTLDDRSFPVNPESTTKTLRMQDISRLLEWYQSHKRTLPWRTAKDPYAVWVSEVMLQQTTVKAVVPFYLHWMKAFPSVYELAKAEEQAVLLLWEGLGYYNRARNLHQSARRIVDKHAGSLPSDYPSLAALPGVGDYTARAILSISFRKPCPVVEANIRRIGQRLHAWPLWGKEQAEVLESLLEELIPLDNPGEFNEAFMELGQTVCLRTHPHCTRCPLSPSCLAFAKNRQNAIPARGHSAALQKISRRILLLRRRNSGSPLEVWIFKKPSGILKGLWLFPPCSDLDRFKNDGNPKSSGKRYFKKIVSLPSREHNYTRYREELRPEVYLFSGAHPSSHSNSPACWKKETAQAGRWVAIEDVNQFPMPPVYRKIVSDLEEILRRETSDSLR